MSERAEQAWRADEALLAGGDPQLVVDRIGQLCTLAGPPGSDGPRRGADLDDPGLVTDAALVVRDGKVAAWGPRDTVRRRLGTAWDRAEVVDAGGRCVVPAWVDPHTHAVFGRTRQDEYERRLRGETYMEIAAAGGGIHASVRDLRARGEEELRELTIARLREMADAGTATVEIKSGYGLNLKDELKMLRVAGAAAEAAGLRLVRTCLAAHEVPEEWRHDRAGYVDLVCGTILPAVAREGLAERVDVFCEPSVFDLAETERIVTAARALGLRCCLHADELEPMGGAALAARLGADSADHLLRIDAAGIAALAGSETVAVLLPGTVFSLGLDTWAPARELIAAGAAVALATDFNPGSSPITSLPLIMAIACTRMKLTPAEALAAATVNAAWALRRADTVGSLAPGRWADFLLLDGDDYRLVPYFAGRNPVRAAWRGGRRVTP